MSAHIQVVAIVASVILLIVVLEMVRRRRLMERYALLWLFSAIVLIGLAAWRDGLKVISDAIGIAYPPTALFVVAFIFILFLLLHFSSAVSRLGDQSKVLAQRAALLEERVRRLEHPPDSTAQSDVAGTSADSELSAQQLGTTAHELTGINRD